MTIQREKCNGPLSKKKKKCNGHNSQGGNIIKNVLQEKKKYGWTCEIV